MLQLALNNLTHDIVLVQYYIDINQQAGFSDMTRLLEALSIKLFHATHDLNLKNKNLLHPNFPAIDLADDSARTAVQVTTNADAKKIRHTLKMFESHNLKTGYDSLIIFGFNNCSKLKDLPTYCSVLRPSDLVSIITDKNDENLVQTIVDAQQHTDFSRLHPYDDLNCLEIVLRHLDRNAVKHLMIREGSYKDMVNALNEISELISKGTINRKSKGKSVDNFDNPKIRDFLIAIRHLVGEIVAIVNENRSSDGSYFDLTLSMGTIDKKKQKIIDLSNFIAQEVGSKLRIEAI
jgi:hypothetical protein